MAIICSTFLYATFFSPNSSNPETIYEQKYEHLHKEIEALRTQIDQMLEKEKLHIDTISDLRATVEQQAKEVK
jgi:Na+/phosphate symporter